MQISIEYLRWFQFVCVTKWRVTGSLDQVGIGLGIQRQRGYFCLRLSIRCKFISFTSPAFCYNILSISVTATKNNQQYIFSYFRGMCVDTVSHLRITAQGQRLIICFIIASLLYWKALLPDRQLKWSQTNISYSA